MKIYLLAFVVLIVLAQQKPEPKLVYAQGKGPNAHQNECVEGQMDCYCTTDGWCFRAPYLHRDLIDCYNKKDRDVYEFRDGICRCVGNNCEWVMNGNEESYYYYTPNPGYHRSLMQNSYVYSQLRPVYYVEP